MTDGAYEVDKRQVRRAFDQAAAHYDATAVLQREVGARMLERLELVRIEPHVVLDLGAGTGLGTEGLARHFKKAKIVALDLAPNMLLQARRRAGRMARWSGRRAYVCGDAERLPLADDSVDVIFSNLTLQWCNDLDRTFREIQRVLRPGGALFFSTFGPDTLRELREAWATVDGRTHVNAFIDMHDIGDAMVRAGLADPVMDVERFTLTYKEVRDLMRDLKAIGAHNVTADRPRGLTGARRLQQVYAAYEKYRREGTLPVTYEIVYGHAWGSGMARQLRDETGAVHVPLRGLKRTP